MNTFVTIGASAVVAILASLAAAQAAPLTVKAQANPSAKPASSGFVSLNPQPIPPGETVKLNPQPIPPSDWSSLNPQPIPPKEAWTGGFR